VKRRTLLRRVSGSCLALGGDSWVSGRADPSDASDPAGTAGTGPRRRTGSGGPVADDDATSLRELARRMDFARPAKRVWGNGPPSATRPDASPGDLVTFHGTEYVRLPDVAARYAYDLGMINRFENGTGDDSVVALTDLSEKGLLECHRYAGADGSGDGTTGTGGSSTVDGGYSVYAIADRHREGVSHRCLWLNTRLVELTKDRSLRDHLIGQALGASRYEVVGLGEVFGDGTFEQLVDRYREAYEDPIDIERGPNLPFCCGLAALVGTGDGERWIDEQDTWESVYDVDVSPDPPWDTFDGAQRVTVGVDLPRVEDAAFDLFLTHLDPYETDRNRRERRKQLDLLTAQIESRRETHGQYPKVLMGDMNIHSVKRFGDDDLIDYEMLLRKLHDVGMQSIRLTRGGPATSGNKCTVPDDAPGHEDPASCLPACYCAPFVDDEVGKNWIDYVFVERPREEHAIDLDLSRMWRVPLNVEDCTCLSAMVGDDPPSVEASPTLTDHRGLGFDLVTSPR